MNSRFLPVLAASVCAVVVSFLLACTNNNQSKTTIKSNVSPKAVLAQKENFTDTLDGKPVSLYIIRNKNIQATVTNYGGRMVNLLVPDKNGTMTDVLVGPDSYKGFYQSTEAFFGALIGRYGNRIAKGKFVLDNITYSLPINNDPNTLHGGHKGFHNVVWEASQLSDSSLELKYLSPDGEQGFPGNLQVKVIYSVTAKGELVISFEASTDKKTVVNLVNHNFWNLNGCGEGSINNHELMIRALRFNPVDPTLIPTGTESVTNTPFDFTAAHKIGNKINDENLQLKYGHGYDHNYVLDKGITKDPELVATVKGDLTGIRMDVHSTEPGLQFYSGNFMQSKNKIKGGGKDDFRTAFCLETQHFPDSPNQPSFPSAELKPEKKYSSTTIYHLYAD